MILPEDTQDKIRRNLVTFSAGIVISAFLDLELTNLFASFSSHLTNVSPFKLWLVISSIFTYLFMRYVLDDSCKKAIKDVIEAYKSSKAKRINNVLTKEVTNAIKNKTKLVFSKSSYHFSEIYEVIVMNVSNSIGKISHEKINLFNNGTIPSEWHGTYEPHVEFNYKDHDRTSHDLNETLGYNLPNSVRLRIILPSLLKAVTLSKGAYEVIIPFILSLSAFIVLVLRLTEQ